MNIYFKLFDLFTADTGKQFMAEEFQKYIANINIIIKNCLIETHHYIRIIQPQYELLRQVYSVIITQMICVKSDLTL